MTLASARHCRGGGLCRSKWGPCGLLACVGSRQRSKLSSMRYLCRCLQLVFLIPLRLSLWCKSPLSPTADHCLQPLPLLPSCGATLQGRGYHHGLSTCISGCELWWSGCCKRSGLFLMHCLIYANGGCHHPPRLFFRPGHLCVPWSGILPGHGCPISSSVL